MSESLKFQLTVTAVGEVRDADGNLLNQVPIEGTFELTEAQAAQFVANHQEASDDSRA